MIPPPFHHYDIFVGIMAGLFDRVTQADFDRALQQSRAIGRPDLLFYFSDAPFPSTSEKWLQLAKVHAFRQKVSTVALVTQYSGPHELIRKVMSSGDARTNAMELVVGRMRALAPQIRPLLPGLQASESAGERLAAVAVLQVFRECAHLPWLVERFAQDPNSDEQIEMPFVAYHAGEALREAARHLRSECKVTIRESISTALQLLGTPSKKTDRKAILEDALRILG
jgi:hypothetical protein